jgi:hypothetical protein
MIDELKKYHQALFLIAVLVLIRFVFVPVFEWQDQKMVELGLLEKKTARVTRLLNTTEQIIADAENLDSALEEVSSLFYDNYSNDGFKLEQQQMVEARLAARGLSPNSIGWRVEADMEGAPLRKYQLQYSLAGDAKEVVQYLIDLETAQPLIEITSLNFRLLRPVQGTLGRVNMSVNVTYYMHAENGQVN